ncbi:TlyA family RNA methyltransferase [Spiroplasma endosymbiont of Amphibalanus improvisus]|uniref:TlyA family RNA methyltransferase n=1 Tax=Spiroplasma endosymbiont of Amphibalanus improvisus TaxID=3066327 RepID=UPI00313D392E
MKKTRIDKLCIEKGLVESRSKVQSLIMENKVLVNEVPILKASELVDIDALIRIKDNTQQFISRGGLKLDKALKQFGIKVKDKICMDIGSSTGGFTDCLLQNGAKQVVAIDVGTNQLDYKLRIDKRVVVKEKTNFRNLIFTDLNHQFDFICCDVSFISLKHIIPNANLFLKDGQSAVFLVKPQFESDKEDVRKGKINSKELHLKALNRVFEFFNNNNFNVEQLTYSPVLGNKKKNIEFICAVRKTKQIKQFSINQINEVIEKSWSMLLKK